LVSIHQDQVITTVITGITTKMTAMNYHYLLFFLLG
jgi:hypothetical protein